MADQTQPTPILALALDVADFATARALVHNLHPYFPVLKVGLELFSAEGANAVTQLTDDGFDVFLDVKLHDIPTTVEHAARVLGRLGARYLTMHTSGGVAMLRGGIEGLRAGAAAVGAPTPTAIGVTVLTSDTTADVTVLKARAAIAGEAGCGGIVCAGPDLPIVKGVVPDLLCVVPGTRPAGAASNDQARVDTPEDAVKKGAGMLVIGRAVTAAADPVLAAHELATSLGILPR